MDLKAISFPEHDLEVDFGEDLILHVRYRAQAITLAKAGEIDAALRSNNMTALADLLAEVVIDWDLEDGGMPYPIEREAILQLPGLVPTKIIEAIQGATEVGKANAAT